ncbi:MAG: hypothetical protein WAX85_02695 [Minisyncoccia bacterium]
MAKYLDKDFFKFLGAFMVIISISLIIIFATKLYQEKSKSQTASVIQSVVVDKN